MKKIIISASLVMSFAVNAQSMELQEGAVVCITQKYLKNYEGYVEQGFSNLANDILERAQCITKKRKEDVFVVSEVGNMIQVRGQDGFKIWVRKGSLLISEEGSH